MQPAYKIRPEFINPFIFSTKKMEEKAALTKFGDAKSRLLDQFERRAFELQLTRAMLGRSLSEPGAARSVATLPQPPAVAPEVRRGPRGSGFQKVLKKLLGPVLGKKGGRKEGVPPDLKNNLVTLSWRTFSRSLRRSS